MPKHLDFVSVVEVSLTILNFKHMCLVVLSTGYKFTGSYEHLPKKFLPHLRPLEREQGYLY